VTGEASGAQRLRPYVGGLALQWLGTAPATRHRRIAGSLAFVDISGFTALTERLAAKGKIGAEEMSDLLDAAFAELLEEAYAFGASLVKWGGDAVLLLFEGEEHAALACRAAFEMRATMRRIGRLRTSVGVVQLKMSIGIESGTFDFFLVGRRHAELLVAGPAATATAALEQAADAGEVLIGRATAAHLPPTCVGVPKGDGLLLRTAPHPARRSRVWTPGPLPADPGACLDPALRDHLLTEVGEGEHRQVCVGFVEVSGVDDLLTGQGPGAVADALHELVSSVQEQCARHAVTFWETDISKDGFKVMLVAGAPRSSGRDEEGVLRAARAVLDRHEGALRVRVGVNAGRVFNGGFGPVFRRTWSVKGDAVNLAARVMGRAGSGELWATEQALSACRTALETEPLEPFPVKGKTQLVRASRVTAVASSQVGPAADLPLFGREPELESLDQAVASARAGRRAVVEVNGDPGTGKSRLVQELRSRSGDLRQLTVVCDAYQSAAPYAAVRPLLRELLDGARSAAPEDVGTRLRAVTEERAPQLVEWLPLLALVAGADVAPTAEADAVDEQFRRARVEQTTAELLRALLPTPTLLLVEDAQHADDASAGLLAELCRGFAGIRWALVVTRRTVAGGFRPVDPTARVDLLPLDARATQAVLASATDDAPLRPHDAAALTRRAEGNPLFLLQLVEAARGSGSLADLPDSVEAVITTRIVQLLPAPRRLLRTAAVLGSRFDLQVLSRMTSVDGDALEQLAEFLDIDGDVGAFRQALVRDAAYEGLPYTRRRDLHAKAGEVLEEVYGSAVDDRADLLSLHFLEAGDGARAWRYALAAGAQATAASAHVAAATCFGRALAAAPSAGADAVAVAQVHEELGDAWLRLGEFDRAQSAYALARKGLRALPHLLARSQLQSAYAADLAAGYPSALRWLTTAQRSLDLVPDRPDTPALRAEIDGFYGLVRHRQGRDVEAVRWCRRAVAEAERVGAVRPLAAALVHLDVAETALGRGDGSNAVRALGLWQELGDAWQEARAHNHIGIRAYYAGRWDAAAASYELARDAALRAGDAWMATIASANVAEILSDQGRLDEAQPLMHDVLLTLRATGARGALSFGQGLMARLLARRGHHVEALVLYSSARRLQHEDGEQSLLLETDARIAECLAWCGRSSEALERAQATLATVSGVRGAGGLLPLLHRVGALALSQLGRHDEALQEVAAALAAAEARDLPHEVAWTLDLLLALDPPAAVRERRNALAQQLGFTAFPPRVASAVEIVLPDQVPALRL
jgi:class 3 adenylate cyclase/tetratricopeptide (TPR) repeat protein